MTKKGNIGTVTEQQGVSQCPFIHNCVICYFYGASKIRAYFARKSLFCQESRILLDVLKKIRVSDTKIKISPRFFFMQIFFMTRYGYVLAKNHLQNTQNPSSRQGVSQYSFIQNCVICYFYGASKLRAYFARKSLFCQQSVFCQPLNSIETSTASKLRAYFARKSLFCQTF